MPKTIAKAKPATAGKPGRPKKSAPEKKSAAAVPAIAGGIPYERATLPIECIIAGENARTFDAAEEEYVRTELLPSVQRHGILTDLWVRALPAGSTAPAGVTHELLAGERRWRAGRLAGLMVVPVKIFADCDDAMARELGLIENLQRRDLNPADRALGVRRMVEEFGYVAWDEKNPERSAGHRLGFNKTKIFSVLKMADLPALGIQAVRSGELSESVAVRLARIPDPKAQLEAIAEAIREEWTDMSAAECIAQNYMTELKGAPFDRALEDLVPNAGSCTKCPYRTGNMMEMFPDLSSGRADVCTSPKCYRNKCESSFQRRATAHRGEGGQVLSEKEAEKAGLQTHYSSIGGEFVDLDKPAYQIGQSHKSWRQVLAPAIEASTLRPALALARDGSGKHFEVIKLETIRAAAESLGIELGKSSGGSDSETAQRREAAAIGKRDKAIVAHQLACIAANGSGRMNAVMLRDELVAALVHWLIDTRGRDAVKLVADRRSLDLTAFKLENDTAQDRARKALHAQVESLEPDSLTGLLCELVAVPEYIPREGRLGSIASILPMLESLDVDPQEIHDDAIDATPGGEKIRAHQEKIASLGPDIVAALQALPAGESIDNYDLACKLGVEWNDIDAWHRLHGLAHGVQRVAGRLLQGTVGTVEQEGAR
jgi:ParB/RepB/Spo0J family partition protein